MSDRTVCSVVRSYIPGQGRAYVVRAEDPASIAIGALTICQAIESMPEFGPAMQAAAAEVVRVIHAETQTDRRPVEVYRGAGGGT